MKLWKYAVAAGLAAGVASPADAQVTFNRGGMSYGSPNGFGTYTPYGGGGVTFGQPGVGTVTTNGQSGYFTPGTGTTSYSYPATGGFYPQGSTGYYPGTTSYANPGASYFPNTYVSGYNNYSTPGVQDYTSGYSYPGYSSYSAPSGLVVQSTNQANGFLSSPGFTTNGFTTPSFGGSNFVSPSTNFYSSGYTPYRYGFGGTNFNSGYQAGGARSGGFRLFR